jgi:hypothetical protein
MSNRVQTSAFLLKERTRVQSLDDGSYGQWKASASLVRNDLAMLKSFVKVDYSGNPLSAVLVVQGTNTVRELLDEVLPHHSKLPVEYVEGAFWWKPFVEKFREYNNDGNLDPMVVDNLLSYFTTEFNKIPGIVTKTHNQWLQLPWNVFGHSLGGAITHLIAWLVLRQNVPIGPGWEFMTIGCPNVSDVVYKSFMDSAIHNRRFQLKNFINVTQCSVVGNILSSLFGEVRIEPIPDLVTVVPPFLMRAGVDEQLEKYLTLLCGLEALLKRAVQGLVSVFGGESLAVEIEELPSARIAEGLVNHDSEDYEYRLITPKRTPDHKTGMAEVKLYIKRNKITAVADEIL